MKKRCEWVDMKNPLYIKYHDEEWGVPQHDDQKLFELLILEGMQAGLSWATILNKRENFRKAFDNFDYHKIAKFSDEKINELLNDEGIIRNKQKLHAAIENARIFINIRAKFSSFDNYIWNFVDYKPIQHKYTSFSEIPAETKLSQKISKELKKFGMKFTGPTIIYSFMQAIGMVNDHITGCFKYKSIQAASCD